MIIRHPNLPTETPTGSARVVKVLFVCLGNICRSPTAEGVFRELVRREQLAAHIMTDSCGTSGWHVGDSPDKRAREEAWRRGIDISDLKARGLAQTDFTDFDYILAMDRRNVRDLMTAAPGGFSDRVHLMLSFAPGVKEFEVPDPYYGGDEGFAAVYDMIEPAARGLLDDIRKKHLNGI